MAAELRFRAGKVEEFAKELEETEARQLAGRDTASTDVSTSTGRTDGPIQTFKVGGIK